jgi:hypothetical protein
MKAHLSPCAETPRLDSSQRRFWDKTTDLRPHCRFGLQQRVPPITQVNPSKQCLEKYAKPPAIAAVTARNRSSAWSRTAALCSLQIAP